MRTSNWDIPGSEGLPICGTTHQPAGDPRGVIILVHGYLGYKDYGMFPWLATQLCAAGHIVHRVNLSHSGMDHGHGNFDCAAFFRDTWSRGVEDIMILLKAIDRGVLAGQNSGAVLVGHSRGGSSCLLTAGRHADDETFGRVVGVVSLSAPASLDRISGESKAKIFADGSLPLQSSRTGQTLQIGAAWLQEQCDEPEAHNLLAQVAKIRPAVGVLHGADDATVAAHDAVTIAQANPPRIQVHIVDGADHVFNTPNPFAADSEPSPQLAEVGHVISEWLDTWIQ